MRTTLTLDPDVAKLLHEEQYRTKKTFKTVLNDAVRSSLRRTSGQRPKLLPPRAMGLRTGIDPRDLAGLADDLEAESYLRTATRRRR
jgi:hypothetical protein